MPPRLESTSPRLQEKFDGFRCHDAIVVGCSPVSTRTSTSISVGGRTLSRDTFVVFSVRLCRNLGQRVEHPLGYAISQDIEEGNA